MPEQTTIEPPRPGQGATLNLTPAPTGNNGETAPQPPHDHQQALLSG